jgi:23S rRNA pseudouridine1911/1915/1917 synthase
MTAEQHLRKLFPTAKRTTLKRMVQTGRVVSGGGGVGEGVKIRRLSEELPANADIRVLTGEPEPPRHRRGGLPIIHEDEDLLVLDKPPGLLTSTVPGEKRPTLLARVTTYLARHSPKSRVGVIHRLDKDARGLIVFSKHSDAFHSLKAMLKDRAIQRRYHAVVLGHPKPPAGRIENRLIELPDGRVVQTTDNRKGEIAISHYETVKVSALPKRALLQLTLETGRKHQLRTHLAGLGHAIVGDVLYGAPPDNQPPLLLIATLLEFAHPRDGRMVKYELPLPEEFRI